MAAFCARTLITYDGQTAAAFKAVLRRHRPEYNQTTAYRR
jgi:hypothetical protein